LFGKINLVIFSSNFDIKNMNFFFHYRIYEKHNINQILKTESNLSSLLSKLFKKKKKEISFVKKTKEIKYFNFNGLYIYSKLYNKSKLYLNYFIKYNDMVFEVLRMFFENDDIFLYIQKIKNDTQHDDKYRISKEKIQSQVLKLTNDFFVNLNEPNNIV
jgi:hypothetical protein